MSYTGVPSPNAPRPEDPVTRAVADTLRRIERNYGREGSGPGSRFEGRLLEDVQAEAAVAMVLSVTRPAPEPDGPRYCARCGRALAGQDEVGWYLQVQVSDPVFGFTFADRVHECDGRPHAVVARRPW